ncbi:hypothetical protein J3458_021389 [Metarhizium acridum]|uniref:uncharacterized protein n=1 Tax=Metarhizium acridum TaxID=92637 RepID=UPI001C6BF72F|nr:hypothetical protein J3458_021389 [Metarhizium acridum]
MRISTSFTPTRRSSARSGAHFKWAKRASTMTLHDGLVEKGESVIEAIRERQPGYNLITNNCQTYALQLLDAIKVGSRKEFGTTLAVYERLIGPGRVKDLFIDGQPAVGEAPQENTVSTAQQLMHDHTTQLDAQEQLQKDGSAGHQDGARGLDQDQGEKRPKKRHLFSRLFR